MIQRWQIKTIKIWMEMGGIVEFRVLGYITYVFIYKYVCIYYTLASHLHESIFHLNQRTRTSHLVFFSNLTFGNILHWCSMPSNCGLQNGVIISFHIVSLAVILRKQINLPLHCMETTRHQLISEVKIKDLLDQDNSVYQWHSYETFIKN